MTMTAATISEYLAAAQASLQREFPGLPAIIAGAQLRDIPCPGIVLRVAEVGPSAYQDTMTVGLEMTLLWKGEHGADVAAQLYGWAYRPYEPTDAEGALTYLHGRETPVQVITGEYDPARGTIDYTLAWDILLPVDYSRAPLTVDGVVIREVRIEVAVS